MTNQERLESHKRMYEWIEEQAKKNKYEDEINDWQLLMNRFPELLNLVEDLIRDLELVNLLLLKEKEVNIVRENSDE